MYDNGLYDRRSGQPERRQDRRAPFVAAVRTADTSGTAIALGLMQNLSATGMELLHPDVRKGRLSLRFELPDGQGTVELAGEVVSARPYSAGLQRAGVRFVELGPAVEERLLRALLT